MQKEIYRNNIDYVRLGLALEYYKRLGYTYIDLPWTVPEWVSNLTKPVDRRNLYLFGQHQSCLVASAEQSFLYKLIKEELPEGKYVGITPCFRDEEVLDSTHGNYFMKIELFSTLNVSVYALNNLIHDCKRFFEGFIPTEIELTNTDTYVIKTTFSNIELGSYGINMKNIPMPNFTYKEISWMYGTGLAEPRFSIALQYRG